jgi:hypothetical protein
MSSAQSLFESVLIKFSMVFLSLVLTFSVGMMLDTIETSILQSSIYEMVNPEWVAYDPVPSIINLIYIMCWVPAIIAIVQPIVASVRQVQKDRGRVREMGDEYEYDMNYAPTEFR